MKKKKLRGYTGAVSGTVILLLLALLLPSIIFGFKDRRQLMVIQVEEGNGVSLSEIDTAYENELDKRLEKLLGMGREEIHVTAIAVDEREEEKLYTLLERVRKEEWMLLLRGVWFDLLGVDLDQAFSHLEEYKKYIVYSSDYQEGIALMLWYVEMKIEESGTRVQLLLDTQTDTLYYMAVTIGDKEGWKEYSQKGNRSISSSSYSSSYTELENRIFSDGFLAFFAEYYEDQRLQLNKAVIENHAGQESWRYPLSYGELVTDFLWGISYEDEAGPDMFIGIELIGSLIPEMLQN